MFGKCPHVLHDELGLFKDVGVDALQDEFIVLRRIQGNNISVIDIAIAELFYLNGVSAPFELVRDVVEIFQKMCLLFRDTDIITLPFGW